MVWQLFLCCCGVRQMNTDIKLEQRTDLVKVLQVVEQSGVTNKKAWTRYQICGTIPQKGSRWFNSFKHWQLEVEKEYIFLYADQVSPRSSNYHYELKDVKNPLSDTTGWDEFRKEIKAHTDIIKAELEKINQLLK
jgi:hypothetical protein